MGGAIGYAADYESRSAQREQGQVCKKQGKHAYWMKQGPVTLAILSSSPVKHGYVFQKCGPDGQWVTDPNRKLLRDAHQCANNKTEQVSMKCVNE